MKKVLIVDDEKLIVKATSLVLKLAGYSVLKAYNGPEGLERAAADNPDVIMLDIMMPGMDGWQVLERLKEKSETADIPVIIFTAKEHFRGRRRSLEAGAADYITKPFEPEDLVAALKRALEPAATA